VSSDGSGVMQSCCRVPFLQLQLPSIGPKHDGSARRSIAQVFADLTCRIVVLQFKEEENANVQRSDYIGLIN